MFPQESFLAARPLPPKPGWGRGRGELPDRLPGRGLRLLPPRRRPFLTRLPGSVPRPGVLGAPSSRASGKVSGKWGGAGAQEPNRRWDPSAVVTGAGVWGGVVWGRRGSGCSRPAGNPPPPGSPVPPAATARPRASQVPKGQPRARRCQSPPGRALMLQRMAPAGSPRGGASAGDRLSPALRASLPPPPFRQPSSVPPPRAAPELWAPGCATAGGARPRRRVSVQRWVLGTRVAGSGREGGPGHYPGPLTGSSRPLPEAEKASDSAGVVGWTLARAAGGGAWNPQALSFLATPLQGSLPQDCWPGGRRGAVGRFAESPAEKVQPGSACMRCPFSAA